MKQFIFFILVMSTVSINAQCAMCKAVAENGDAEMAEGLNAGIMFLMAFPYILVGGVLFLIYRYKVKKKN